MSSTHAGKQFVNHLIALSQADEAGRDELQEKMNAARLARVEKALLTKPVYIELSIKFDLGGRLPAYNVKTPTSNNDYMILGAICDNLNRQVTIKRSESSEESFFLADAGNTRLTTCDIAGSVNPSDKGEDGVLYYLNPLTVEANRRLSLDFFKLDDTVGSDYEFLNLVFIGLAINKRKIVLTNDELEIINRALLFRDIPEKRLIKQTINYNIAGQGGTVNDLFTPLSDEPLMIRGIASTMKHSRMSIKIEDEPDWMFAPVPIWGLAAMDTGKNESFRMFERPIYLPAKTQMQMDFVNGIGDDVDEQKGNTVTFLCETI